MDIVQLYFAWFQNQKMMMAILAIVSQCPNTPGCGEDRVRVGGFVAGYGKRHDQAFAGEFNAKLICLQRWPAIVILMDENSQKSRLTRKKL